MHVHVHVHVHVLCNYVPVYGYWCECRMGFKDLERKGESKPAGNIHQGVRAFKVRGVQDMVSK